jgi:hypothetical protein
VPVTRPNAVPEPPSALEPVAPLISQVPPPPMEAPALLPAANVPAVPKLRQIL